MADINEQIAVVEKELRELPHHKGTDHHIGRLRAKLAMLNDKMLSTPHRQGSGGASGYAVRKQGDATVILVGPPSAGKSTLINKLTNAESKVAAYAFTTLTVIPGMMEYNKARIQILDVPGLIEGAQEGKGRGKEVLSVARNSDLIIFMTDPERLDFFKKLVKELEQAGIRINKQKPLVKIDKKTNGGLAIHSNIKQDLSKEIIKDIANEFGIKNGEITINEKLTLDRLIDAFARNRVYVPAIYVVNKVDGKKKSSIDPRMVQISAEKGTGIDEMKAKMWEKLQFVTIELLDEPKIVKSNLTLKQVAEGIGTDFAKTVNSAKIWGKTAKFDGQEVSLKTKVLDGMKIQFY